MFHAFNAQTGKELWSCTYPAAGKLDYGNSPRATPLIIGKRVITLGALGHLNGIDLNTGKQAWQVDLTAEFDVDARLPWGFCGSPLPVDGKVVVFPGGNDGALAAFDQETGEVAWRSKGKTAAYGSFILAELGGKSQIVGFDEDSLGGWSPAEGKRLWSVTPRRGSEFHVPTPLVHKGSLIVSTENNGTRLFRFRPGGEIVSEPAAQCEDLHPDTQSSVIIGNRLFGVSGELFCLDLDQKLKLLWRSDDAAFTGHVSLIASDNRLLACSESGEILLIDPTADRLQVVSRFTPFRDDSGLLSHPAVVGTRLYLRGTREIICLSLQE